MAESSLKSRSKPDVKISSDVFRTNVTAALLNTPRARAHRLQKSSSVLGVRDREEFVSDDDGNAVYVGRKKKRERAASRALSAEGRQRESEKWIYLESDPRRAGAAIPPAEPDPTKRMVEDWHDKPAPALREVRPVSKKVLKHKKNTQQGQYVKFCQQYVLKLIRFIAIVIGFAYWAWLVLSFVTKQPASDMPMRPYKRHGVVSRYESKYAYDFVKRDGPELSLKLVVYGPFVSEKEQKVYTLESLRKMNKVILTVVLERWFVKNNTPTDELKRPTGTGTTEGGEQTSKNQVLMYNQTTRHERSNLDYNNYPRKVEIQIAKSPRAIKEGEMVVYMVGFGTNETLQESVPFSYEVAFDPITIRARVMYSVLPLLVFIFLLIFGVNRAIAAMMAVATSLTCFARIGVPTEMAAVTDHFEYDYIFFVFACLLLGTLVAETNVQSTIAYYLLKLFRMQIIPVLIFVNVVTGALCFVMNNILITELMLPVVMRLFELMGLDATPGIINFLVICNVMGRSFIGTYASKHILKHKEAKTSNLKLEKLLSIAAPPAAFVALVLFAVYFVLFLVTKPYKFARMRQIEENEHLMRLCDLSIASIPDHSKGWHRVRLKVLAMKAFFAFEIKEMRARVRKYGPEPKKSVNVRLQERRHQCMIQNKFLLIKCCLALGLYLTLIGVFIYNKTIKQFHEKEDMRLGYIGLFLGTCAVLLVHSRDLEVLLKRIDWESIIVIACLSFLASVFSQVCDKMPDYMWKAYGKDWTGYRKKKVHYTLIYIIGLTAIAGVANEYTIFWMFLDTAFQYSITESLNCHEIVLGGFFLATGFWGIASTVGTCPNLIGTGQCYSQGYSPKITFLKFTLWGVPTAVLAIFLLYVGLTYRLLHYIEP